MSDGNFRIGRLKTILISIEYQYIREIENSRFNTCLKMKQISETEPYLQWLFIRHRTFWLNWLFAHPFSTRFNMIETVNANHL